MQFKQKLIYFALGCAFMVISQVLSGVVVSKVTAQGKKESVEFDTVTCRSLKVVDDAGKVRAQLEVKKNPKLDFLDDIIQVFNRNGHLVFNLANGEEIPGMVTMFDKMGERRVEMRVSGENGNIYVYGKTTYVGIGWGSVEVSDEFEEVELYPHATSETVIEIGEGHAVKNIQFKIPYSFLDVVRVIGEVQIPAYVAQMEMEVNFSLSLFNASGKYLGGEQFSIYGVNPEGGIYPFSVEVEVVSKDASYCKIRPHGAWETKEK